jgi:ferric-dicitrate binding protein FerR (iron transport regulator)
LNEEETDYIASWKDQVLSFNNESFEEMAHKLQRWYNVKIIIKDEKLKTYRYKGKFNHVKSIFQVLEVVKLTTPITYEYDEKAKEIIIEELKEN